MRKPKSFWSAARKDYYELRRIYRVFVREHVKVMTDTLIFGTGALRFTDDLKNPVKHVPFDKITPDMFTSESISICRNTL